MSTITRTDIIQSGMKKSGPAIINILTANLFNNEGARNLRSNWYNYNYGMRRHGSLPYSSQITPNPRTPKNCKYYLQTGTDQRFSSGSWNLLV